MPIHYSSCKTTLLRTSFFLAALIGLLTPIYSRADVIVTVDKGQSASQHKASAPSGGNSGSGGGGGRTSTTDTVSGSIFFTITVRNLAASPAKGVTIEYHVFNKTLTSGSNTPATVTLADITASSTIDLDGNAIKVIETTDIPKSSSNTVTSGNTSKKGVSSPGFTSSTITSALGWVVYVKKGDRVIHTFTSSDTVLDEVAKINKKNGS
jgi:hypothetical protein